MLLLYFYPNQLALQYVAGKGALRGKCFQLHLPLFLLLERTIDAENAAGNSHHLRIKIDC